MKAVKVIEFPACQSDAAMVPARSETPTSRVKNGDGVKYFSELQIKLIRRTVWDCAELDAKKGKVTAIREWIAIDLITLTGARVPTFFLHPRNSL